MEWIVARMLNLTSCGGWQMASLQARQRLVRQEEITAEVIELAAGETATHAGRS